MLGSLDAVTNEASSANPTADGSTRDRIAAGLDRLPRVVLPLLVVVLVAVGIGVGGPLGALFAGLGIAGLTLVLFVSWPRITFAERLLRIAVLALLVGLTVVRTVPN